MNLVSVMISISIMSFAMLGSLQGLNNQFKGNVTSQVNTDINSFANNARTVAPTAGCQPTMGFCYTGDVTESGQTYMVFTITKHVFGSTTIRRLKPTVYIATNSDTGCNGNDNGNHNGQRH